MLTVIDEDEILEINDYVSGMFGSLYTSQTINKTALSTHEQIKLLTNLERKVFLTIEPDFTIGNNLIKDIYNKSFERTKSFYLAKILKELLKVEFNSNDSAELIQNKKVLSYLLGEIGYLDSIGFSNTDKSYINTNLEELSSNNKLLCSYIEQISLNNNCFNFKYFDTELENGEKRDIIVSELFNGRYNQYFNTLKGKFYTVASKLFRELLFYEITKLESHHIEEFITYLLFTPKNISYQVTNSPLDKLAMVLLEHSNAHYLLKEGQKNLCKTLNILISRYNTNNSRKLSLTEQDKNLLLFFIWLKKKPAERIKTIEILNTITERQNIFALENPNLLAVHLCKLQEGISKITNTDFTNPLNTSTEKVFENNLTPQTKYCAEIVTKISDKTLSLLKDALKEENICLQRLVAVNFTGKAKNFINNTIKFTIGISICLLLCLGYYNFFNIEGIYKNNFIKTAKSNLDSIPYPSELKDSKDPTTNKLNQKKRLSYIMNLNSRYFKTLVILLAPDLALKTSRQLINSLSIPSNLKDEAVLRDVRIALADIISKQEWERTFKKLFGGLNILIELNSYGAISNFLLPSLSNYVIIDKTNMIKMLPPAPEKEVLKRDFIMKHDFPPKDTDLEPRNYINKFDSVYLNLHSNCNLLVKRIRGKKLKLLTLYRTTSDSKELKKIKNALSAIAVIEVNLNDLKQKILERRDYIIKHNTYRLEIE